MLPDPALHQRAYAQFCEIRIRNPELPKLPLLEYTKFRFERDAMKRGILQQLYPRRAEDFAREIINDFHNLRRFLLDLGCWQRVLPKCSREARWDLIVEFIEDRAILALGRPAAIKARLIYAAVKLAQIHNRATVIPKESLDH